MTASNPLQYQVNISKTRNEGYSVARDKIQWAHFIKYADQRGSDPAGALLRKVPTNTV